jgi:S-adenosylmethionine synthetase
LTGREDLFQIAAPGRFAEAAKQEICMSIQCGLFPFEGSLPSHSDKLRAFSGEDRGMVDRSGACASRYVALRIVATGIKTRCTVQLSYGTGWAKPIPADAGLHRTSSISEKWVTAAATEAFDLMPAGAIATLKPLWPIHSQTSILGHFGNQRDPADCKWEANPHTAAEAKPGVRLAD